MERSFVIQFTLGHPKDCVYVVSVKNITDPLFVFQDYGNDGLNFFAHYPTNIGVLILGIDFLMPNLLDRCIRRKDFTKKKTLIEFIFVIVLHNICAGVQCRRCSVV